MDIEKTVIELYRSGKSQEEILREIGKSGKIVRSIIISLEKEEMIVKLHNEGKSYKKIKKEIGINLSYIQKAIKRLKKEGKIQEEKERKNEQKEENRKKQREKDIEKTNYELKIIKLYNERKSIKYIADNIEKSEGYVSTLLKILIQQGKIVDRKREEEARIIKLYNEGKRPKDIAEEIELPRIDIVKEIERLIEEGKIVGREEKEEKAIDKKIPICISKEIKEEGNIFNEKNVKNDKIERKNEKDIKTQVEKILSNYYDIEDKYINIIHNYIKQCQNAYIEKELSQKDIELLEECIEYLDNNSTIDDIKFLATIYLEEDEDKKSLRLINANRTIEERKKEDKQLLLEMYYEIKRYMNIKQALYEYNKIGQIDWKSLEITEIDYIKIKSKAKFEFSILKCCEQLLENKQLYIVEKRKTQNDENEKQEMMQEEKNIELYGKERKKETEEQLEMDMLYISKNMKTLKEKISDRENKEETKIIELYYDGESYIKIGDIVGEDPSTVSTKIKKMIEEGKILDRDREEEQKIIELYNAGKLPKDIANITGKINTIISKKIKKLIKEGKIQDRDKEETIIKLYNDGKSQKEIADTIGISQSTLSTRIKKLIEEEKLEKRKNHKNPNYVEEQKIIKLYNAGVSQRKIANEIGKTQVTVSRKIKELIEQGKIQDRNGNKEEQKNNDLEKVREEKIEKDKEPTKIEKDNNEMTSYINDVKKIIDLLKKDMAPTYVQMRSIDTTIQKNAIKRMDSIEILIDDLRKCMNYINGNDEKKKVEAEKFIKRICDKYRTLEEKQNQIEQRRKMQLRGR